MENIKAKKILIVGISGTGKTYFARKLSEIIHLPVFHLDTCIWKENWIEASQAEQEDCVRKILAEDQWILEGFITPLAREKLEEAELIIYLDFSGWRATLGGLRRFWQHRGRVRPEMPSGCIEKFDWNYLKVMFNRLERPEIEDALIPYQKKVVRLRSSFELKIFLKEA